MKRILLSLGAVIAVMTFLPLIAHASSLQFVDYYDTGYYFGLTIDGVYHGWAEPGEFQAVVYDDNGQLLNNGEWFTGFCVEPETPISLGEEISSSVTPEAYNSGVGLEAAWLLDTYYYDKAISSVEIAGLQLALWEVVQDDAYNLSAGYFQASCIDQGAQAAIDIADLYLADLNANFGTADINRLNEEYEIFVEDGKQNLIFKTGIAGNAGTVPEPSTMFLLGSGIMAVLAIARKKRQK